MLFWNDGQITAYDLKQYFKNYSKIMDMSLFQPAQCIYVAKPLFEDCSDPVPQRLVEINPQGITTDIRHEDNPYNGGVGTWFVNKQSADNISNAIFDKIAATEYQALGYRAGRHDVLLDQSRVMGKLVGQEHYSRDYASDWLWSACEMWGNANRDRDKDRKTIDDGLDLGVREYE
jgi:hypothetical protein